MKGLEYFRDDGTEKDYNMIYVGGQGENRFETARYVLNK